MMIAPITMQDYVFSGFIIFETALLSVNYPIWRAKLRQSILLFVHVTSSENRLSPKTLNISISQIIGNLILICKVTIYIFALFYKIIFNKI